MNSGSVNIDLTFSQASSSSVTAIFYLEYDGMIEISKEREEEIARM